MKEGKKLQALYGQISCFKIGPQPSFKIFAIFLHTWHQFSAFVVCSTSSPFFSRPLPQPTPDSRSRAALGLPHDIAQQWCSAQRITPASTSTDALDSRGTCRLSGHRPAGFPLTCLAAPSHLSAFPYWQPRALSTDHPFPSAHTLVPSWSHGLGSMRLSEAPTHTSSGSTLSRMWVQHPAMEASSPFGFLTGCPKPSSSPCAQRRVPAVSPLPALPQACPSHIKATLTLFLRMLRTTTLESS